MYAGEELVTFAAEQRAAKDTFTALVTDKWLVAKVIERRVEGQLFIHLWDCSTDDYVHINRSLVEQGYAESVYPLPEELNTDCETLASSSYHTLHSD